MKCHTLLLSLALLPMAEAASAQSDIGGVIYTAACQRCHGADGAKISGADLRGRSMDGIKTAHDYALFPTIVDPQKDLTAIAAYLGGL
ncbi:mono/diheme cytochrome c family protein [Sagittula marina]|uniref:Mono/diheme cytochrome c family protein n=1 Tax=Sagittula marina TaxID=943940 RepID=A0A7W6GSY1_9RHOB|nr:cytochrome c [Sagittula marina]MBB3986282.1 mono/diheme cytochrome c family protein [Sagittula marina]